ncbi:zinc finger Ran-binding domain-containing protein 2-like [Saccoglossus kowalevskii]|uniref:Zinc finger Ran-binding domain-containing protein 2 n=1 Tax=Saccoglossus kowalevskii TaxID=10224 RepID=A0ABM0MRN7_SACKO|nr:PREDICTED: zinc finger Ran-binding domain-containing protein 2-like [Saccoglossus kowalevskii]
MADEVLAPLAGGPPFSNKPNFKMNDGDWVCEDEKCGNVNFARRRSCNRCGKDKSNTKLKAGGIEIGKSAAEKSRGLFSANDWQCKTCGNVNWARRNECNMCHTPKMGKIEERTGYGGGYNERSNVEYVEREDSDSEYDEFGRRKKGYRKSGSISNIIPKVLPTVTNTAEEEEEEESGDEADLSNYKLDSEESGDDEDLSNYKLDSDSDDEEKLSKNDVASDDENNKEHQRKSYSRSLSSRSRSRSLSTSRSRSRSSSQTSSSSSSRSRSRSRSSSYDSRSSSQKKRRSNYSSSRSRSRSRSKSPSGRSWKRRKHHHSSH